MSRVLILLTLAATAALLWWLQTISASYQLFSGGMFTWSLDLAASVATALLAVVLVGQVVIQLVLLVIYGTVPTGYQRAGLYAVLGGAATAAVLTHLGVNVTAVLTTSAILTAVIGLALQPTLGGLIGGLTLHTDRVLRIGDAILQDGEPVEVTAFNWRSVSGRKFDGSTVIFPNARIVDRTIEILPRDRSVRAETRFPAPITTAPQRMCDLIGDLVGDFAQVDDRQPVIVAPVAFDPEKALASYRIRYWVHAYADRNDLEAEVLRRVWYALQREGIAWPVSDLYEPALRIPVAASALLARDWREAVANALAHTPELAGLSQSLVQAIAEAGVPLFYPETERIVLPARVAGSVCVLVAGQLHQIASEFDTLAATGHPAVVKPEHRGAQRLSRRTTIKRIADRLAEDIGPFAESAVLQAANEAASPRAICRKVAGEIADPVLRQRFLSETCPPEQRTFGPGSTFRLRRDVAGNLVPDPLLRALEACALIAIPSELLVPSI